MTSGVIECSALSTLLFLLRINKVFKVIRKGVPLMLTDDDKIIYWLQPEFLGSTVAEMI